MFLNPQPTARSKTNYLIGFPLSDSIQSCFPGATYFSCSVPAGKERQAVLGLSMGWAHLSRPNPSSHMPSPSPIAKLRLLIRKENRLQAVYTQTRDADKNIYNYFSITIQILDSFKFNGFDFNFSWQKLKLWTSLPLSSAEAPVSYGRVLGEGRISWAKWV